jgi:hypothetical protein
MRSPSPNVSLTKTLTTANHVIHLSRWWNPAVEDQCTDRIYRIGQEQAVRVYYPMAIHPLYGESSFDELLRTLLTRKRSLSQRMLLPPVNLKRDENWFADNLGRTRDQAIEPAHRRPCVAGQRQARQGPHSGAGQRGGTASWPHHAHKDPRSAASIGSSVWSKCSA